MDRTRIGMVGMVLAYTVVLGGCGTWTAKDGTMYQSYWSAITPTITKVTLPNGDVEIFAGGSILNQSASIVAQAVRRPNKTNVTVGNNNANSAESDQAQGQGQGQAQGQAQGQYQDQDQEQYQDQDQDQDQDQEQNQGEDDDSDCLGC